MKPQEHPLRRIWNIYKQGGLPSALNSAAGSPNAQQVAYVRSLLRQQRKQELTLMKLGELETAVFDLETTGFSPYRGDEIISIGAVKMNGEIVLTEPVFHSLVNPNRPIPPEIELLTGISNEQVRTAPALIHGLHDFFRYTGSRVLIAHGTGHDKTFLKAALWKTSKSHFTHRILDTMMIAKWLLPKLEKYDLDTILAIYGIRPERRHDALQDALSTAQLWARLLVDIRRHKQAETLADLYAGLSSID